jgi:hypothetical protein
MKRLIRNRLNGGKYDKNSELVDFSGRYDIIHVKTGGLQVQGYKMLISVTLYTIVWIGAENLERCACR